MKNCPSCGRPVKFEEKYARVMACGYCNSVLEFGEWELNKIGEQSELIEFPSLFVVGKTVMWKEKEVYVKWQLRYEYDWGFFDEFFVVIEWKELYIHEDDGKTIIIHKEKEIISEETLLDKSVWSTELLLWKDIFIQENWLFRLVHIKWFVNTNLIPWKEYEYLDGVSNWKMLYFTKEVGESKIRISHQY